MAKIKLYKFRSLANRDDFGRVAEILKTGRFWCSRFSSLNDPMEGVFSISAKSQDMIDNLYNKKSQHKICSFSGQRAFENCLMWGYYANGFKGLAIEIEIDKEEVHSITYVKHEEIENVISTQEAKPLLLRKLDCWEHECEYRFLTTSERNQITIGTIKALYFGNPYGTAVNQQQIIMDDKNLRCYNCWRQELINIAVQKGIASFHVKMEDDKVKKLEISANQDSLY